MKKKATLGFITRRRALLALGGSLAASGMAAARPSWLRAERSAAGQSYPVAPQIPSGATVRDVLLKAGVRQRQLMASPAAPTPVLDYADGDGPLVIRMQKGEWLRAELLNGLEEHTSVHWHGVRVPNAMDGVPYLTQPPVMPGGRFTYAFRPPDTGTFFFHPHCNTVEQLGRGLAGVLVVEGDAVRPFDHDLVCASRDWRLDGAGRIGALMTAEGAAKAGTFGSHRTVNDRERPVYRVPANGDIRIRFLNLDMSRIIDLGVTGAPAWLIATDGNALRPLELKSWRLGPAMRADLSLRAPSRAGERVQLVNYYSAEPVVMAEIEAEGAPLDRPPFRPGMLRRQVLPEPDLARAETFQLRLGASSAPATLPPDFVMPDGTVLRYADALCLAPKTLWALNGQPWPSQGHEALPPPLVTFRLGATYVIEIINQTQHMHPVHLHGHTFQVLSSNRRAVVPHFADTTLVAPKERLKVALVADNPGDWMIHCHIIEHQETGMMGIFRVA